MMTMLPVHSTVSIKCSLPLVAYKSVKEGKRSQTQNELHQSTRHMNDRRNEVLRRGEHGLDAVEEDFDDGAEDVEDGLDDGAEDVEDGGEEGGDGLCDGGHRKVGFLL